MNRPGMSSRQIRRRPTDQKAFNEKRTLVGVLSRFMGESNLPGEIWLGLVLAAEGGGVSMAARGYLETGSFEGLFQL